MKKRRIWGPSIAVAISCLCLGATERCHAHVEPLGHQVEGETGTDDGRAVGEAAGKDTRGDLDQAIGGDLDQVPIKLGTGRTAFYLFRYHESVGKKVQLAVAYLGWWIITENWRHILITGEEIAKETDHQYFSDIYQKQEDRRWINVETLSDLILDRDVLFDVDRCIDHLCISAL